MVGHFETYGALLLALRFFLGVLTGNESRDRDNFEGGRGILQQFEADSEKFNMTAVRAAISVLHSKLTPLVILVKDWGSVTRF